MADDERVPEGGETPAWWGRESMPLWHGRATTQTVDERDNVAIESTVAILGEKYYPPLRIIEIPSENESISGTNIRFEHFVFPTDYEESFKSRWKSEDLSHGRLNPIFNYGGTERQISLDFVLPAKTTQEAVDNLKICGQLAKATYGRYRTMSVGEGDNSESYRTFAGNKRFVMDFGSLIRKEVTVIEKFSFTANLDAGVFDYQHREHPTDVTHIKKGNLLPRELKVSLSFKVIHDYPLGFGGPNRPGEPLRWAENRNKDWPHGTGDIAVQEYMSRSQRSSATQYRVTNAGATEVQSIEEIMDLIDPIVQ